MYLFQKADLQMPWEHVLQALDLKEDVMDDEINALPEEDFEKVMVEEEDTDLSQPANPFAAPDNEAERKAEADLAGK